MRNKILNTFKNKGFISFFVTFINFVLHTLFKVELVGKNIISIRVDFFYMQYCVS